MMKGIMVAGLMLVLAMGAGAQTASWEELAAIYNKDHAVYTNRTEHVKVSFKDGKPVAHTEVLEEQVLLTEQAPAMYAEDYVYHGFFIQADEIKATAEIPDGKRASHMKVTEMTKTRSKNENVFYDDASQTKITYRGLKKGSAKKLSYSQAYPDMHFFPSYYFQKHVPVMSTSFSVSFPKTIKLRYVLLGDDTGRITMTRQEKKNETIYTWTATNLPAVKHYDDGLSFSYYVPHVQLYIESYNDPGTHETVRVLGNVADLHHYYTSFINQINQKPDTTLANLAATITAGAANNREKAERIYKWVQQNIRYVAFEDGMGGFTPREPAQINSKRYGDCKDMTSIQVALCRLSGVPACYAWIGTRDIPYDYVQVPLPIVDNHMICMTKIDGQWLYMDGTNDDIAFGQPPEVLQGKKALVSIDDNHYELVEVPVAKAENNAISDTTVLTLDQNGRISGSIRNEWKGYGAWRVAGQLKYSNPTEIKETLQGMLSRGSNKFVALNTDYRKLGENSVALSCNFELADYTKKVGKERFVNLNLMRSHSEYIDTTQRKVPVAYRYRDSRRQVVKLHIPDGYHVNYLPPAVKRTDNNVLDYNINYRQEGNEVMLVKEMTLKTMIVNPNDFKTYNDAVRELKNHYKESIVLVEDNPK
jgi:transglutaminase-like putative cysteine protease